MHVVDVSLLFSLSLKSSCVDVVMVVIVVVQGPDVTFVFS